MNRKESRKTEGRLLGMNEWIRKEGRKEGMSSKEIRKKGREGKKIEKYEEDYYRNEGRKEK